MLRLNTIHVSRPKEARMFFAGVIVLGRWSPVGVLSCKQGQGGLRRCSGCNGFRRARRLPAQGRTPTQKLCATVWLFISLDQPKSCHCDCLRRMRQRSLFPKLGKVQKEPSASCSNQVALLEVARAVTRGRCSASWTSRLHKRLLDLVNFA